MLTVVIGPNGSGKSLFALQLIANELIATDRQIVTTLAVHIPRFHEYLSASYKAYQGDAAERITFLPDETSLSIYWRSRGWLHNKTRVFPNRPVLLGPYGDSSWKQEAIPPVLYVLDEAQVAFSARGWSQRAKSDDTGRSRGQEWTDYQTQHRHYGDDVIAIAPASSLLDKNFRNLAGECIVLTNWYRVRVKGFKPPGKIKFYVYVNCPPAPAEPSIRTGEMKLEPQKLASCYDTAAGVGVVGKGDADKNVKVRGIDWKVLPFAIIAIGFLAWFGVTRLMHYGQRRATHILQSPQTTRPAMEALAAGVPSKDLLGLPTFTPDHTDTPTIEEQKKTALETSEGTAVAWAISGDQACVQTDDGRTCWGKTLVETPSWILLDGYRFSRVKEPNVRGQRGTAKSSESRPATRNPLSPVQNPTPTMFPH